MNETNGLEISELDGAKLVKGYEVDGIHFIQVWYGGHTINVYANENGFREVDMHSMSYAETPDREAALESMERHYDFLVTEGW